VAILLFCQPFHEHTIATVIGVDNPILNQPNVVLHLTLQEINLPKEILNYLEDNPILENLKAFRLA